jgi:hypothetical protein
VQVDGGDVVVACMHACMQLSYMSRVFSATVESPRVLSHSSVHACMHEHLHSCALMYPSLHAKCEQCEVSLATGNKRDEERFAIYASSSE